MFFHFLRIVAETRRTEACKIPWRRERRGRFSLEFLPFVSAIKGIGFRQKRHPTTFVWWYLLQLCVIFQRASCVRLLVSTMATKIKGIYKGFKYISQIFVVKEREMEIGYPTDVKHVAHIGWDGPSGSGNAPSWMTEFNSAPDFSTSALGNPRDANGLSFSTWSSQDLNHSMGHQPVSNAFNDIPPSDLPNVPKKAKRKKKVSTSSPKSSSSATRSSRSVKSKAVYHELESSAKLQV